MTSQLTFVIAALCAGACIPLVFFAAHRTATQPVSTETASEATLIACVLADPALYRRLAAVTAEDFVWEPHQRVWAALESFAYPCRRRDHIDEAHAAGVPAKELIVKGPNELHEWLQVALNNSDDLASLDTNTPTQLTDTEREKASFAAGGQVVAAAADRKAYPGASPLVETNDFDKPLVRRYTRPTVPRICVAAGLAGLAGFAAAFALAPLNVVAVVALVLWILALSVIALVDYDTMYIDMPVFWVGSALALVLGALGGPGGVLLPAVTYSLGTVVGLAVFGVLYRWVRGVHGLGSGDLYLVAPLVAFPILLGATATQSFVGIWAAAVLAAVVIGTSVAFGRRRRDAAFAFGPYLALGWPFGLAAAVLFAG